MTRKLMVTLISDYIGDNIGDIHDGTGVDIGDDIVIAAEYATAMSTTT